MRGRIYRMRFRKLRIAWSVGLGFLCVLLIVLWVRSYTVRDSAFWPQNTFGVEINSMAGHIVLFISYQPFSNEPFSTSHEKITNNDEERVKRGILGFVYRPQLRGSNIHIHFWFLTIAIAGAAAIPWIHLSGRFTLRTLLIAMTLLAAILGFAVYFTSS